MSDFRAIGGVSSTLQALLSDRMELPDSVASVPVTIGPPPFTAKDNEPHQEDARVNLFLYRVTENGYLQNQEIPGRGAGNGYGHPPLSVNLHYLVTAYGTVQRRFGTGAGAVTLLDDTQAHQLLGSAMRVLHDTGVITDRMQTVRPPSGLSILDASLRDGYERVKLTLEPLTLEDVTKVWTALALRFRLSAAYVVTVVQIESRRPTFFPQPVGQPSSSSPPLPGDPPSPGPWVFTLPIQTPTITTVSVRRLGDVAEQPTPYARIGDTLVLRGTNLTGPVTEGAFGDLVVPATVTGPGVVEVTVPDATIPGGGAIRDDLLVQPGVRTVQVRHRDPNIPVAGVTSNEAVLMVVPSVDPAQVAYLAGPRRVAIAGSRLVSGSGGQTMIGRASVPSSAYVVSSPTQLEVPIPTTLPERGVRLVLGGPLNPVVQIGAGPHDLTLTIGGVTLTSRPTGVVPSSMGRSDVRELIGQLVRDARPAAPTSPDPNFTGARVELWGDRLAVIPGDLTSSISVAGGAGTLAHAVGLDAGQPTGASAVAVSGLLMTPPVLTASAPELQVRIGATTRTIAVPRGLTSLEDLAAALEAALHAAGGAAFTAARVGTSAGQLVLVPGTGGTVTFSPTAADDTTVRELQWHADFAVRVRVNGAESIDPAVVELPQ
jgi:hypothetical protein